jgi:AcrR family transcriptional regulator
VNAASSPAISVTARPSKARARLLGTAAELFYTEGIRAVGVDRVIAEASVTRATFYRHFSGKEALVAACLAARDAAIRERAGAAARQTTDPGERLALVVDGIGQEICGPGFRGCPFINAATEYPDPDNPVHRAVLEHRAWFRGILVEMFRAGGHPDPEQAGDIMVALRDGAMVAGSLGDPAAARATLIKGTETLLDAVRGRTRA